MKSFKVFSMLFVAITMFMYSQTLNAQDASSKQVVYQVDIGCQACVDKINNHVSKDSGVESFTADLNSKTVTIKYNAAKTDAEKIQAAISEAGYTAKACTSTKNATSKCCDEKKTASKCCK